MGQERDEWLMSEVAAGKHAALEVLVRRYANPLLTFIRRWVGDRHRSEELFQDVVVAVWRKRKQYQLPRPFKPWLYAIALNTCRAAARRRQVVIFGVGDDQPLSSAATDESPTSVLIASEHATLVTAAVARLPVKQRAVVVLRTWSGLSYGEIADVLGCREATARAHMHHALAALRVQLEPRLCGRTADVESGP